MTRGLLLDLDDTLYAYAPAEEAARSTVQRALVDVTGRPPDEIARRWNEARATVHRRIGGTASSHSRLLYLHELASALARNGRPSIVGVVPELEALYWDTFLATMTLRPGAVELLDAWRAAGHRVALVTDLTLDIQLRKVARLGLGERLDAIVASEEVGRDKPDPTGALLAIERLGVRSADCVVVGDSVTKDGGVAAALGIPFHHVDSSRPDLVSIRAALLEPDGRTSGAA